MRFVVRSRLLSIFVVPMSALALLFACKASSEDPGEPDNEGGSSSGDINLPDIVMRRETGTPTKCAIYNGATAVPACSCGEQGSMYTGAPTDVCPVDANPNYCIAYDVNTPLPAQRACTCQPKCLFQHVGSGGEGGGGYDTCRCGVSSHLVLGGDGSKDLPRASCDGFSTCCKDDGTAGCDCSDEGGYTCPTGTTKVASCSPADFNTDVWRAEVYGNPNYSNLVEVDKCK